MRAPILLLSIVTAILLAGVPARAAPLDKREIQARADFAAGRYQQAVERFAELFAQTADPVFLRNIARCYQKMKRPQEAIDGFNEYLHKAKDLTPAERTEIEGFIKEMEALRASQQPPAPPPPPPQTTTGGTTPSGSTTPATTPVTPTPSAAESLGPRITEVASAPEPSPAPQAPVPMAIPPPAPPEPTASVTSSAPSSGTDGRTWRVAGIATASAGAALMGAGLMFGIAARSAGQDVSKQWDPSTDADGKRYEKLQWVGYGVGAAALATGAFLYVHGMDKKTDGLQARAAFDRQGGALLLEGTF